MEADSNLDDSKDSERLLISTGAGYSDGQGWEWGAQRLHPMENSVMLTPVGRSSVRSWLYGKPVRVETVKRCCWQELESQLTATPIKQTPEEEQSTESYVPFLYLRSLADGASQWPCSIWSFTMEEPWESIIRKKSYLTQYRREDPQDKTERDEGRRNRQCGLKKQSPSYWLLAKCTHWVIAASKVLKLPSRTFPLFYWWGTWARNDSLIHSGSHSHETSTLVFDTNVIVPSLGVCSLFVITIVNLCSFLSKKRLQTYFRSLQGGPCGALSRALGYKRLSTLTHYLWLSIPYLSRWRHKREGMLSIPMWLGHFLPSGRRVLPTQFS